ncbi:putative LRR receptor-like serine/threonine-protein kinase [Ananas comosus]|uniref:Putative LRR receptor-like serine/threonine-protein kinase n=1 Tax=Ananas comosus TaxID=4615 RepID=A0A199VAI5_ANACO|nr:putative LRR receptor-like serine/threonine-protein kinase [Ananas comosus]
MQNYILVLSLLALFFSSSSPVVGDVLNSTADFAALYGLRASLGIRSRDWPRKADPCTNWAGVGCRTGRVVSLTLSGLRRTRLGKLDPRFDVDGLRNLSRLVVFNASGFLLPGPIPVWFGRLSLTDLGLRFTGINGSIPVELGRVGTLRTLDLSHNSLGGSVPAQLGNLTALATLDLSHNNLSGDLTASLLSLPYLTLLDVSANNLTGELPDPSLWGANATGEVVFNLSTNLFYGPIQTLIEGRVLRRFRSLDVSDNYFEGQLAIGGAITNASLALNCFRNASDQRNPVDCEEFYRKRGLVFDDPTAPPPPPPPPPPESSVGKRSSKWKYIVASVVGGVALLVVLSAVIILCALRSRTSRQRVPEGSTVNVGRSSGVAPLPPSPSNPRSSSSTGPDASSYERFLKATEGFGNDNLIKHGRTGDLYHGMLEDGAQVVVKRIDGKKTVKKEWIVGELGFFEKVSHERFVPFLGHCSKGKEDEEEVLLVYKYVIKGDLTEALHRKPGMEEEGLASLDWITRLKIAIGVAEALCFLHHECDPPLVHRDIQASSVLLDDKFEVRLGSLSEVCAQQVDGPQNVFTRMLRSSKTLDKGTSGSPATYTYDIYCFGKVLLELVTGKLGISAPYDGSTNELLENILTNINIYEKELVTKIMDPSLIVDEDHLEEVWAVAIVAKSCLNPKPARRPLARYILKALENPLKVVRNDSRSNSARLKSASSRSSWQGAFRGSWRQSSETASASGRWRDDRSFRLSVRSQGSGGDHSFSLRRSSREIGPEPVGLKEEDTSE